MENKRRRWKRWRSWGKKNRWTKRRNGRWRRKGDVEEVEREEADVEEEEE